MPFVEEGEKALEHLVGDVDVLVLLLDLVHREHAAVQVRNAPVLPDEVVGAGGDGLVESVAEELLEEAAVERFVELVPALPRLRLPELVAEVVLVEVEEALLLDEVAEHEPVEHHGRVPLAVVLAGDVLDSLHEHVVLLAEGLVELLGHLGGVHEERRVDPVRHVDDRGILVEGERDRVHLLQEEERLVVLVVLHRDKGALVHRLDGHGPQVVERLGRGDEDHEVVVAELALLRVDEPPHGGIGDPLHPADEHLEALLRDLLHLVRLLAGLEAVRRSGRGIGPEALQEELPEVAVVKIAEKFVLGHCECILLRLTTNN